MPGAMAGWVARGGELWGGGGLTGLARVGWRIPGPALGLVHDGLSALMTSWEKRRVGKGSRKGAESAKAEVDSLGGLEGLTPTRSSPGACWRCRGRRG